MLLHVEDVTMAYRESAVLWDIDLDVPTGVRCAIVGPNGAGKSTLLKGVLGLEKPVAGYVRLWGKKIDEVRERIAYVPQRGAVNWDFPTTVFDVVLMGRYVHIGLMRRPGREDRERARAALAEMQLEKLAERQISELPLHHGRAAGGCGRDDGAHRHGQVRRAAEGKEDGDRRAS